MDISTELDPECKLFVTLDNGDVLPIDFSMLLASRPECRVAVGYVAAKIRNALARAEYLQPKSPLQEPVVEA